MTRKELENSPEFEALSEGGKRVARSQKTKKLLLDYLLNPGVGGRRSSSPKAERKSSPRKGRLAVVHIKVYALKKDMNIQKKITEMTDPDELRDILHENTDRLGSDVAIAPIPDDLKLDKLENYITIEKKLGKAGRTYLALNEEGDYNKVSSIPANLLDAPQMPYQDFPEGRVVSYVTIYHIL